MKDWPKNKNTAIFMTEIKISFLESIDDGMDRDEANGDEMFLLDPKCDQHSLSRCDGNCA